MKYINENGRSMVEMLGVLAIIGVLSVGGIAGYSKAMNKYKINKTTDQVSMLVANIRTLFSSQGNYEGLNNASAIRFGVVPEDMYTGTPGANASTYEIKNAFNGAVTIATDNAREGITGNDAFVIAYNGLSSEACVTILTGDWGSGQGSGLIGIAGGVGEVSSGTGDEVSTSEPVYTGVKGVYVDKGASTAPSGTLVVASPGSTTSPTPVSVTDAVNACTGGGAGNTVAWKYY